MVEMLQFPSGRPVKLTKPPPRRKVRRGLTVLFLPRQIV
jgi:hypothetical protein